MADRDRIASGRHHRPDQGRALGQDAASVAGLLVTTEAMVAEHPKKETPMPMPPGGGIIFDAKVGKPDFGGGMDFQGPHLQNTNMRGRLRAAFSFVPAQVPPKSCHVPGERWGYAR
jgi:hypothetical protein